MKKNLRSKWRTIIEGVQRPRGGQLNLPLESLDLFPPSQDALLLLWKVDAHNGCGGAKAAYWEFFGLNAEFIEFLESE